MLKVGLTGGIGSGKSTVAKMFEVIGIPVFNADLIAKDIVNTHPAIKKEIIALFGEESYSENLLNRKLVGSIVFNDEEKLKQLNAIIHPVTIAISQEWMKKQTAPYAIKEAAILFESGSNKGLDIVIGVSAPLHLRIQRTMKRDNVAADEVEKRIARQMNQEEKMKKCDFVIYNDEVQAILPQVISIDHQLRTRLQL
jgi:dephospho-CoA kinase